MNDEEVLALYYAGNLTAPIAAEELYGDYCRSVAGHILKDRRDVEECVGDALVIARQTVLEAKPKHLGAYLAKLTRNAALNKYRSLSAKKRGGGVPKLAFSEIEDIISPSGNPEDKIMFNELCKTITKLHKEVYLYETLPYNSSCRFVSVL